jgi:RNA polymerase sigma-70 factor, ECF subfamily
VGTPNRFARLALHILHNQHGNTVRRSVREGASVAVEDASLAAAPTAGSGLEMRDLGRAISRLPAEQREVVLLVGHEGLRYEEIASTLGIPIGTVRSRLSRARAKLRELMDMNETAPPPVRKCQNPEGWRRAA